MAHIFTRERGKKQHGVRHSLAGGSSHHGLDRTSWWDPENLLEAEEISVNKIVKKSFDPSSETEKVMGIRIVLNEVYLIIKYLGLEWQGPPWR